MFVVLWLLPLPIILYTIHYYSVTRSRSHGARQPPGPRGKGSPTLPSSRSHLIVYLPGLPLIGNLLQIPPKHSWLKFYEWSQQYGPLYRLNVMGRNQVIISTEKIANALLRERGNLYSSREQLPMAAKLMSRDLRPLLLPYGGAPRPRPHCCQTA